MELKKKSKAVPCIDMDGIPIYSMYDLKKYGRSVPEGAVVIATNGMFHFKRTPVGNILEEIDGFTLESSEETESLALTEVIDPSFSKIPMDLYREVATFFLEVYNKYKSEAVVLLLSNDGMTEWTYYIPHQEVTPSTATYSMKDELEKEDSELVKLLSGGWNIAGTIHSHADMKAFHSSTDDDDEKNVDGVHITIGRMSQTEGLDHSFSVTIKGKRFMLSGHQVIEGWNSPFGKTRDGWMSRVSKKKYETGYKGSHLPSGQVYGIDTGTASRRRGKKK